MSNRIKIAILDMNNGHPNQGLNCIKNIAHSFDQEADWKIYDVRVKGEIPDLSYDIYICSGGPGSPLEAGQWHQDFTDLIDQAWAHNQINDSNKKYFFFICYSFQVACGHFDMGELTRRKSTSFGVLPVHMTQVGREDTLLADLPDPYYVVDSRDWQLVQPNLHIFDEHGADILSLETIRTFVDFERAIMAVRFSGEFVGTQFHPEADAPGMKAHFSKIEMREKVINNFGQDKYLDMMEHLEDPDKISLTHKSILPGFISRAITKINQHELQVC